MNERKTIFDEDADVVLYRVPLGRVKECAEEWFHFLFTSGVDALVCSVATPEMVLLKDCPHGEIAHERFERFNDLSAWYLNATRKELFAQDTDILYLASQVARSHGKSIHVELRMSDAHHYEGGLNHPLFPQFVWDHPELCIQLDDGKPDIVLDYSLPEVRARRIAVIRDIVENYDVDGVNLNWMRWCRHFAKGKQREKAHILTEFLQDVRKMLDEVAASRGRERYLLSHYVAAELEESLDIGCDVREWARLGLADFLMPMDFILADFNIRTDEFVSAVEGTDCGVYPALQRSMMFSNKGPAFFMTPDKYRAAVHNYYSWGAHGISCFNFCCWGFDPLHQDTMLEALDIMSSPEKPLHGERHYHFLPTWRGHGGGICPTGRKRAQVLQFRSDEMGKRLPFTFRMADGRGGEELKGSVNVLIEGATSLDAFELDVNGAKIPADSVRAEDRGLVEAHGTASYPPGVRLCVRLEDCPPFAGDNDLGIAWIKKNAEIIPAPRMWALEITVET